VHTTAASDRRQGPRRVLPRTWPSRLAKDIPRRVGSPTSSQPQPRLNHPPRSRTRPGHRARDLGRQSGHDGRCDRPFGVGPRAARLNRAFTHAPFFSFPQWSAPTIGLRCSRTPGRARSSAEVREEWPCRHGGVRGAVEGHRPKDFIPFDPPISAGVTHAYSNLGRRELSLDRTRSCCAAKASSAARRPARCSPRRCATCREQETLAAARRQLRSATYRHALPEQGSTTTSGMGRPGGCSRRTSGSTADLRGPIISAPARRTTASSPSALTTHCSPPSSACGWADVSQPSCPVPRRPRGGSSAWSTSPTWLMPRCSSRPQRHFFATPVSSARRDERLAATPLAPNADARRIARRPRDRGPHRHHLPTIKAFHGLITPLRSPQTTCDAPSAERTFT